MGLILSFDIDDLGLPAELESENFMVPVDYSDAFADFVDTFIEIACDLVPVDTGFLMSTIDGNSDSDFCEVFADADYAQYVEYGTYKMSAQPYFRPAVEEAAQIFFLDVQNALMEAQEELENLEEALAEEEEQQEQREQMQMQQMQTQMGAGMMQGGTSFLGSIIATVAVMAILWIPMVFAYGIADTISGGHLSGGRIDIGSIGDLGAAGDVFTDLIEIY